MIGYEAGKNNQTGSHNLYINDPGKKAESARLRVAGWIDGGGGSPFTINSKKVSLDSHTHSPSSKHLKKNIKPFKSFQKSLQDILKTPLFTFQLKKDSLKKERVGVISEELPPHLQIKEKGKPSRPDWTSIYGTFWGAVKALYQLFMEFQEGRREEHKSLSRENRKLFMEWKRGNKKTNKEIERLKGQIKEIRERD